LALIAKETEILVRSPTFYNNFLRRNGSKKF
jgi:hypothetical protein